jgi:hypothetical protein
VNAGRRADLNSSHRDDHSTKRCGGSSHRSSGRRSFGGRSGTSGMVATSDICRDCASDYIISGGFVLSVVCQKDAVIIGVFFVFFIPLEVSSNLSPKFGGEFLGLSNIEAFSWPGYPPTWGAIRINGLDPKYSTIWTYMESPQR